MSGILRSIAKKFISKRIDAKSWNVGPGDVSGIRMLTDPENPSHLLAILTVPFDPQSAEPIKPTTPAGEVDPFLKINDALDLPLTLTALASVVHVLLYATKTTTLEVMTLHDILTEADYTVPTGKKLIIYRMIGEDSAVPHGLCIGYADDGVALGTTLPTNPVSVIGVTTLNNPTQTPFITVTNATPADYKVYASIPAGKLPFFRTNPASSSMQFACYGIEVDA